MMPLQSFADAAAYSCPLRLHHPPTRGVQSHPNKAYKTYKVNKANTSQNNRYEYKQIQER
jgi:hypothetical protein